MTYASVCVLSYERPEFLRACLESIRDAGEPFELIVHDDGSRNDKKVKNILGRLLDEGMISRLLMNAPGQNEGVGAAVARCFSVASGDLFVKVDQDLCFGSKDVIPGGWLSTVRDIFDADHTVGCVGAFAYHHEPCKIEDTIIEQREGYRTVTDFVGSLFAVPRHIYELPAVGPIEMHAESFSEDVGLKKRIQAAGYELALPDEDLCINVGFGIGPSTVCVAPATADDPGVQKIKTAPKLQGE